MAPLAILDEILVDIFLRLTTPEDLIRASAVCVSFRRLVADRSFLRRFRKLHPPLLLGFIDYSGFHPAEPPHPSAPAASAVAADFSFDFLPAPAFDWSVREVRDGRVLLDRPRQADEELGHLFKEMVVCDPLHRQYLLLPPLPDDLAVSVVCALLFEGPCFGESFLAPPGDDEEETSFRVIWMMLLQTKPMAAVFSSGTGQWRAFPSLTRSESLPGFVLSTWRVWFLSRHYAHDCFYWVSGSSEKLLVLDIRRMEFSLADHPPCVRYPGDDVAILEAGQGMTVMFVPKPGKEIYTIWRNNGGSSTQWQMDNDTFSLDSGSLIMGAVGRHLLLYHVGSSSVKQGCYTRDVDTFQLERVCASCPHPSEAYYNFPPSLLSLPTVSSGTRCTDVQGAGDDAPVPELREADRDVQGSVVAAAAGAPNPLVVVKGTRRTDVQGAGDDAPVPELREADRGVQGSVFAAAAGAPNPLVVVKGTCGTDVQGAGNDVSVPELREADPGGVQGPVVAVAARALTPLFVVEATPHADVHGARDAVPVPEPREAGPGGVTLCNAGVVQGAGVIDVLVPGPQEADPVGVQGPVVAVAAQAPNPADNDDDAEADRAGARMRRRGWGWGWSFGGRSRGGDEGAE